MSLARITVGSLSLALVACAGESRFPLRDPMWRDTDLASVRAACHREPSTRDPDHVACAPRVAESRLYWDGMDNLVFRPLSEGLGIAVSGEAVDVNSFDEVPDSAWFTNRIGAHALTIEEVTAGACRPEQILHPETAPDGSWVIDRGKAEGATAGFRIVVPGQGKFMLKAESREDEPERQSAAVVVSTAIFHAAGYYTPCEQVVWVRPALFKLNPGLRSKPNFGDEKAFDQKALDAVFADSPRRNGLIRMSASAWIEGRGIGPYDFEGTRGDDPNDVIPHQDRRELRGMRVLSSWLDRYDTRRGNTFDTWIADAKDRPDSSPGHVLHYQIDFSETLGGVWPWDPLARRIGHQYVLDWGGMTADFLTLGIPRRAWDTEAHDPVFGYFSARFDPDAWRNAYPNAAYSRATERDDAWMARILARFTPEMIDALAKKGDFTDPSNEAYLAYVLRARLDRLLARELTRVSPITDVKLVGDRLCGVDLAEQRKVRPRESFRYMAHVVDGRELAVERAEGGKICVPLAHENASYVRIAITDGVACRPLVAHVYDLGTAGFRLVGLERPECAAR